MVLRVLFARRHLCTGVGFLVQSGILWDYNQTTALGRGRDHTPGYADKSGLIIQPLPRVIHACQTLGVPTPLV